MANEKQLYKKIFLKGEIKVLTGLRIGASKDSVEIGGIDLPVIRRKDNGEPYLPGSSIKGKMRCLIEQASGVNLNSKFEYPEDGGKNICQLFGNAGKTGDGVSRIQVRDAYMTPKSAGIFRNLETTDLPFTEVKFENVIDRVQGKAKDGGLRQIERVPAGAVFEVNFVINVFAPPQTDKEGVDKVADDLLKTFKLAFNLLLDDYLGGHGSRGYGQIELVGGKMTKTVKAYNLVDNELNIDDKKPAEDFVIVGA